MQKANLYEPIHATTVGPAPLVVRAVVTTNTAHMAGGVPASNQRAETYVLLSALPAELQERVKLAVQALITGG